MATRTKNTRPDIDELLDDTMSDAEMDRDFALRQAEIEAMVEEGYAEYRRGECVALEPLHAFLKRGHERRQGKRTA